MTIPPPQDTPWAHHWDLDPAFHYLNHGSFGACPRAVLEHQTALRQQMERQPVHFMARELEPMLDAVRRRLGGMLACDPDHLALIPNATTGVNTVLRSLRFEAGDEIVITDHEYNACRNAVDYVAERSGAKVIAVHADFPGFDPQRLIDDLEAAVTPRTRLVLCDHITSPTALILPIRAITAAMERHGVPVMVDGAHGPGQVPLDLPGLGVAFYTGNAHKWLCAPKGAAVLYVHPEHQKGLRPLVVSHGANSPRRDRSRFRLEMDWTGTGDPTPLLCIPAAMDFLESLMEGGIPALQRRNHELALDARDILRATLGLDEPCDGNHLGSMAALPLPEGPLTPPPQSTQDHSPLYDRLQDHRIEVPVMPWPALGCWLLRVSAQAYNSREQYVHLAEVLEQELG